MGDLMKILIADVDTISRRLTQKALDLEGYEVLAVENGSLPQNLLQALTARDLGL
jgi:CheY-like chemotaxis protein